MPCPFSAHRKRQQYTQQMRERSFTCLKFGPAVTISWIMSSMQITPSEPSSASIVELSESGMRDLLIWLVGVATKRWTREWHENRASDYYTGTTSPKKKVQVRSNIHGVDAPARVFCCCYCSAAKIASNQRTRVTYLAETTLVHEVTRRLEVGVPDGCADMKSSSISTIKIVCSC